MAVGLLAGLLGGGFGIGGGLILVPSLIFIGLDRHRAHATSLAGIVLIAITGALSYGLSGSIALDVGVTIGVGGVVGSFFGATAMNRMSARGLTIVFGLVLLVAGTRMVFGGAPEPGVIDLGPVGEIAAALGIGLVAGFFAGIAGIGGGVVNVPSMVFLIGLPQLVAQGSSFVAVVMTTTAASFVNLRNKRLIPREGVFVGLGGAAGALTSSQIALGANEDTLRMLLGVLVLFVALRTLYRVLRAAQSD